MKPYKTKPVLKERIWGTESWETYDEAGTIPLLVKFIDTKDILSVQVHPDDKYARLAEGQPNGKTELWVILDCSPEAMVVYGFNKEIDKSTLHGLIADNRIADALNTVKVRKGDCIFIPSGTVHTLGKDIKVYEVQQPSDLTYRLFDWNRTAPDGSKRELHVEKALDVLNFNSSCSITLNIYDYLGKANINILQIAECEFFDCIYLDLKEKEAYSMEKGDFKAVSCISGSVRLVFGGEEISCRKGETCIIPADYDEDAVVTSTGGAELIISSCKAKS